MEEKDGRNRGKEIRCVRHRVYRRINGGKETIVMRCRRRDKGGGTEERNTVEKKDRGDTEGDSKGKDRGSERGKRQKEKWRKKRQK